MVKEVLNWFIVEGFHVFGYWMIGCLILAMAYFFLFVSEKSICKSGKLEVLHIFLVTLYTVIMVGGILYVNGSNHNKYAWAIPKDDTVFILGRYGTVYKLDDSFKLKDSDKQVILHDGKYFVSEDNYTINGEKINKYHLADYLSKYKTPDNLIEIENTGNDLKKERTNKILDEEFKSLETTK